MRYASLSILLVFVIPALSGCQQLRESLDPKASTTTSPRFNPREYEKVAVLVIDNTGRYRRGGVRRQVEDNFIQAVLEKGYRVASRSDVERIKDELEFQDSGWTAEDYAEVGEMLNVSAILIVSIDASHVERESSTLSQLLDEEPEEEYYSYATVGSRLIGVSSAEVLWVATFTGKTQVESSRSKSTAIPWVSSVVAEAFPPKY